MDGRGRKRDDFVVIAVVMVVAVVFLAVAPVEGASGACLVIQNPNK